jgi:hypothetical protein
MADKKTWKKSERKVTPVGVFVYPKLNAPDTKFKADGEYGLRLRLTREAAAPIIADIDREMEESLTSAKAFCKESKKNPPKKADPPYKDEIGDDGEPNGNVLISIKMKAKYTKKKGTPQEQVIEQKPLIFDAHKQPLEAEIWGGTEGKVCFSIEPFFTPAVGAGTALRLYAVQVLKLVSRGGGDADSFGFADEGGEEPAEEATEGVANAQSVAGPSDF